MRSLADLALYECPGRQRGEALLHVSSSTHAEVPFLLSAVREGCDDAGDFPEWLEPSEPLVR